MQREGIPLVRHGSTSGLGLGCFFGVTGVTGVTTLFYKGFLLSPM
jgi:hypothetical protein